jgi:hypothetical protein
MKIQITNLTPWTSQKREIPVKINLSEKQKQILSSKISICQNSITTKTKIQTIKTNQK